MKRRAPVLGGDALAAEICRSVKRQYQGPSPAVEDLVWQGAVRLYRPLLCDSGDRLPSRKRLSVVSSRRPAACSPGSQKGPGPGARRRAGRFERRNRERFWSANGKGTHTGSRCLATECPSRASVTVRFPRSRAKSPAVVGQDRDSSGYDCLRWRTIMERPKSPIRRCAIYTRKSSEEGLEQDFNSLHAQREACEAFIKSQAGEGWRLVKAAYNDGGLSGGTMERPALQGLLSDINQGLIDVVVVYKVDRLTRSLSDFAKMVEVFDARGVSFVAVTQQFNTTTSMGRLTLNVLLSFAQFEREVTGERIRDKIAASKQKGMWMGGLVPLGYDVIDRRLEVNQSEAQKVLEIFRRYLELGSVRLLMEDLNRRSVRSKVRVARNGKPSDGNSFSVVRSTCFFRIPSTSVRFVTKVSVIGPAQTDRGARALGENATVAAEPGGSGRVASDEISPKSAHPQAVRRKRPEPDAKSRGKGRATISLLRVAPPDQGDGGFGRARLAIARTRDRADRRGVGLPNLEQPDRNRRGCPSGRSRGQSTSIALLGGSSVERAPAVGGRSRSSPECLGRSRRPERYRHPRIAQSADTRAGDAARCERPRANHYALLSHDNHTAWCRDASASLKAIMRPRHKLIRHY